MKMTMHIDEVLLEGVMAEYGCVSKTEAVEMALREADRRAKLKKFAAHGLGFTADELRASVDPEYDLINLRVAETPGRYGTSGSSDAH